MNLVVSICILVSGALLAACSPKSTAEVALGPCTQFLVPPDGTRAVESWLSIWEDGAELSGTAKMLGDPDDYPRQYRIAGPTVARLQISRAEQHITLDLAIPTGTDVLVADEGAIVRCQVADYTT